MAWELMNREVITLQSRAFTASIIEIARESAGWQQNFSAMISRRENTLVQMLFAPFSG